MRSGLLVALTLALAACVGDGAPAPPTTGSSTGVGSAAGAPFRGTRDVLTAYVFPLDAPPARFTTSQSGIVTVRLEPFEGGTAMWIGADGPTARRIDWFVEGSSIYCSDGPDRRVEFLRIGARPGTTWESSGRTLRFEGWERVETPAGFFDAVRISSTLEVAPYVEVETWWFAPGVGLVELRVDKGDLYSMEMKRVPLVNTF